MLLARLPELGLNVDHMAQQLENDGVVKFTAPFDKLLATLLRRARSVEESHLVKQSKPHLLVMNGGSRASSSRCVG